MQRSSDIPADTAPTAFASRALVVAVVAAGALLAATIALWAHFGGTVFYEMIAAGLAACF